MKIDSLNTIKGLACISVVLLHCTFPGEAGKAICYLFKFAVPCFFMISGYFLYSPSGTKVGERCLRRAAKILKLLVIAFLLYGTIDIISGLATGTFELQSWISRTFAPADLPRKLMTGTFFNGTMWYLYALIWAYLIIWGLNKRFTISDICWLAVVLLVLHIGVRTYIKVEGFDWFKAEYFRNFWGFGVPFILIGYYLAANPRGLDRLQDWQIITLTVIGVIMQFVEYSIFRQPMDIFFGSVLFSIGLFAIAIKYPQRKYSHALNYIGERLSMPIYIGHIGILMSLKCISWDGTLLAWIKPVVGVALCIIAAWIWDFCVNWNTSRRETTLAQR